MMQSRGDIFVVITLQIFSVHLRSKVFNALLNAEKVETLSRFKAHLVVLKPNDRHACAGMTITGFVKG